MIKEGTIGFQERNVEEQKNESSSQSMSSRDQNDTELSPDVTGTPVAGRKKPSLIEAALQRTAPSEILSMLSQIPVDVSPATPQRNKSTNKEYSTTVKQPEQNLFTVANGTVVLGKKEGSDSSGLHHRSVLSNS
jgi:hypothetical protein